MPFVIGETRRLIVFGDEKINFTPNKSTITFCISSSSKHQQIRMREPDIRISCEAVSIMTPSVGVDEEELAACSTIEEAYSKISHLFSSLHINPIDKQMIGYRFLKEARSLSRRKSYLGCSKLINVELLLTTTYWWQGSIPASSQSIEDLEGARFEDCCNVDGHKLCCSICLEEFQAISEVKRLPCEHIFHGNCILHWLNNSHCCPLCRFQMPVSCVDLSH